MSRFVCILLIILSLSFFCFAQAKHSSLPVNIEKWHNSHKLLNNDAIKKRLKKLLGKQSFADFMESWETINPIIKRGNVLFSNGCLIHSCGHAESAIAIDLATKTVHAAIYRDGEKLKIFNEFGTKTPNVISSWAKRLLRN